MEDFFEIDFLSVDSAKSGDAISLRYRKGNVESAHVVDAGYQDTGASLVEHVQNFYGYRPIDHVVATHPDGDHAAGLATVLEQLPVQRLWMLKPWDYAADIIHRFTNYQSVPHLQARLRKIYPHLSNLEKLAEQRGIPISEPFQGAQIGAFTVLGPSRARYLDLVVDSERTPESESLDSPAINDLLRSLQKIAQGAASLIAGLWGHEIFSPQETSAENEMSVVQYAEICSERILLTGDAGRSALTEAADFAVALGVRLPGIQRFQVPHHGSRRNVSTELLDRWLGPRIADRSSASTERFKAIISASKQDADHPRKAVVRAIIHRGGKVFTTEDGSHSSCRNSGPRPGWYVATPLAYPESQEE